MQKAYTAAEKHASVVCTNLCCAAIRIAFFRPGNIFRPKMQVVEKKYLIGQGRRQHIIDNVFPAYLRGRPHVYQATILPTSLLPIA